MVGGMLLLAIIGGLSTYSLQLLAKTCEVARALPEQETDSDDEYKEEDDHNDGKDADDTNAILEYGQLADVAFGSLWACLIKGAMVVYTLGL